jgi:hypothetical protein
MIKKPLLLIGSLLLFMEAQAQFQKAFQDSIQPLNSIEISGDYNLGSTALTNSFINTYYLGNHINDDLKNTVSKRLMGSNYFGGDLNYGLTYTHFNKDSVGLFGMKNTGYFIGIKNRQHTDGKFSQDLFNIVFNGNQAFRGKTADLSNVNLNDLKYQQLEIGLVKTVTRSDKMFTIGAGLSFLNGQKSVSMIINNGSLYTQQDGEYINFTTNMDLNQSDTSRQKFGASNGFGTSAHLYFSYATASGSNLKFEIADLGFIRWNNKSTIVHLDTTLHFEGVGVNNIFNFKDPAYTGIPSDSAYVAKYLKNVKHTSYTTFLPAFLQLSFNRRIDQFTFLTGIKYRLAANYIPYVFMGASYHINKNNKATAIIGFGGYSKLNLGLEYAHRCGHGFQFVIGSQFVSSSLFPASGSGQGAYVSVTKSF